MADSTELSVLSRRKAKKLRRLHPWPDPEDDSERDVLDVDEADEEEEEELDDPVDEDAVCCSSSSPSGCELEEAASQAFRTV